MPNQPFVLPPLRSPRRYDPDRSGTLCMAEFVAMSVFLQSASATFRAFDSQQTGRVTLDFSQVRQAVLRLPVLRWHKGALGSMPGAWHIGRSIISGMSCSSS